MPSKNQMLSFAVLLSLGLNAQSVSAAEVTQASDAASAESTTVTTSTAVPMSSVGAEQPMEMIAPPKLDIALPGSEAASSATTSTTAVLPSTPIQSLLSKPKSSLSPTAKIKVLYSQGKYRDCMNEIATQKPTEFTHYYAGLCLQGQGQLQGAGQEFQWVAYYAKDPMMKRNAMVALQNVMAYGKKRTYAGQGNLFARTAAGGSRCVIRRG